jgi:hypothetical protein
MVTVTRRAAWRDGAEDGWHDDFIWYAAAVHRMKARTADLDLFLRIFQQALQQGFPPGLVGQLVAIATRWGDPMSLGYHSQVHGTFVPKQSWPRHRGQPALWQECAHNHWFFLPRHRAYLLEFEAVVREHIRQLGGPADDWALPYWNYSDHAEDARRLGLPLPLRGETLPDGVQVPGVEPAAVPAADLVVEQVLQPAGLPVDVQDRLALVEAEPAELVEDEHPATPQLDHLVRAHPGRRGDTGRQRAGRGPQRLGVVGEDLGHDEPVGPDSGAAQDPFELGGQPDVDLQGGRVVPDELVDFLRRGAQRQQVQMLVPQAKAGDRVRVGWVRGERGPPVGASVRGAATPSSSSIRCGGGVMPNRANDCSSAVR